MHCYEIISKYFVYNSIMWQVMAMVCPMNFNWFYYTIKLCQGSLVIQLYTILICPLF